MNTYDARKILKENGVRATKYAIRVARGHANLSGTDLKGKAANYGGSYARTRQNVVEAMQQEGWDVVRWIDDYGKLELVYDLPNNATPGRACACSKIVWNARKREIK